MKRALLISIHPEWAEKILIGKKTIEIRTWIPKGELPLEVLIYVSKGEQLERHWTKSLPLSKQFILYGNKVRKDRLSSPHCLNGKVVAKFTLNYVSTCLNTDYGNEEILKNACLTKQELDDYVGKRKFFAWHIDKLEIFDKPKELSEFWLDPIDFSIHTIAEALAEGYKPIQRAPQKCAWVYGGEQS